MKFRVTMKDPDGVYECIRDTANEQIGAMEGLEPAERELLEQNRHEMLSGFASKWLEYSEYATLEFDTDAGTCTVVPNE